MMGAESGTVKYHPNAADKKMPPADTAASAPHAHYTRLLEGMARVVAVKEYADITIADIVRIIDGPLPSGSGRIAR